MNRVDRLDLLLRLLRDRPGITVAELAERLGTSTRSIFRDVAHLRDRGYPIEASRGRGGGMSLHPSYGLGRVQLSPEEAVGTLLGLAVAELLAFPMFARELRPARAKIVGAFPSAERQRIKALRSRILVGPAASRSVRESYGATDPAATRNLQAAFVRERIVEIDYRKPDGSGSRRRVEPHVLLLNWPAWYLLGFDHLRGDVRTFRLDRVASVAVLTEEFRPRPRAIARALEAPETAELEQWSL